MGKKTWKKYVVIVQFGLKKKGSDCYEYETVSSEIGKRVLLADWTRHSGGLSGKRKFWNNLLFKFKCVKLLMVTIWSLLTSSEERKICPPPFRVEMRENQPLKVKRAKLINRT